MVSLADTSSSLSSELVSSVASSLTGAAFVSDVAGQVGAAVDTSSVAAAQITRQPTQTPTSVPIPAPTSVPIPSPTSVPAPTPTIPPSADPVSLKSEGATSTNDSNSAGDGDNLVGALVGSACGLLGLGLAAYFFFWRAKAATLDDKKSDDAKLQHDAFSSDDLQFAKSRTSAAAPAAAAPQQQNAVAASGADTAPNYFISDPLEQSLVEGSVKHFLYAEVKVTDAKRLNELNECFSKIGYLSTSDFQGILEEELIQIKDKTGLFWPEMRRFKAALETVGKVAKGFEPSNLPAAKINPSEGVKISDSAAGKQVSKNSSLPNEPLSEPQAIRSIQECKNPAEDAQHEEVAPAQSDFFIGSMSGFFDSAHQAVPAASSAKVSLPC